MKLDVPFVQLPLAFDAERMLAEIDALGEEAWRPHPQGYEGNSALPLISTHGDPDDDSVAGVMRATPYLARCPTLVAALGALDAVWGRSRLMRLSGHAEVPAHADLSYYWRERVRVHVPILTQPTVRFICGEAEVHMAPGECWIFDTWRRHRVINDAARQRIHLVADTVGSERFWDIASGGRVPGRPVPGWHASPSNGGAVAPDDLAYESVNMPTVMSPWELRDHLAFLIGESAPHPQLDIARQFCVRLGHVWLGLWARHGDARDAWPLYRAALDPFAKAMMEVTRPITLRNGSPFLSALGPMVLRAALADGKAAGGQRDAGPDADAVGPGNAGGGVPATRAGSAGDVSSRVDSRFDRPIFIVSAPRSGSTLLFETLARAPGLYTVGGESHGRIEKLPALHPAAQGFQSNRLDAAAATPELVAALRQRFLEALRDRDGNAAPVGRLRMLEKTPKNALRIPFLRRVFPEARFIFLHRDPREVIASMIDAWQSGQFRTYPQLPDWSGPDWSLLLVPGWRELRGRPLPEIVAHQWEAVTSSLLDDLGEVPADRRSLIRHDAFVADPQTEVKRLCDELDLRWDVELPAELPLSRHTLTAPVPDKWRRHERDIESIWAVVRETAMRVQRFVDSAGAAG